MITLATSQYQPRLSTSSMTNVAPCRSANQIAVFTANY